MSRDFVPSGRPTTPAWPPLPPRDPPLVRADSLTDDEKRLVWRQIKATDPNLLAFVTDPVVAAFCNRSGAVHLFPQPLVDAALGRTPKATTP